MYRENRWKEKSRLASEKIDRRFKERGMSERGSGDILMKFHEIAYSFLTRTVPVI